MPRVRIEDVAAKAGVSGATVSKAMRGLPVAEETRELVFNAAKELGWTPNPHAAALASGRTGSIGAIMVFYGVWYDAQMLRALDAAVNARGKDLLVWTTQSLWKESAEANPLLSIGQRVDGLILVDFAGVPQHEQLFAQIPVPIVSIGGQVKPVPTFGVDNQGAAEMAVDHLVELGHRRIAFVGHSAVPPEHAPNSSDRYQGYVRSLSRASIEPDADLVLAGELGVKGGEAAWYHFQDMPNPPTAAFCVSDEIAFGLIFAMSSEGLVPPHGLSLVGFDDHEFSEHLGLTTVRQPIDELVEAAITDLQKMIDVPSEAKAGGSLLPTELVVRSSTGPASS